MKEKNLKKMILKILVSVLLLNQVTTGQIVSVKLYYECLCPFSREMIINHLYPTSKSEIGKYMNIELLPINNGREVSLYFSIHLKFNIE